MNMIRATYRDGHFVPVEPADVPEGSEWEVIPCVGQDDKERTPEEIEREIAAADAVPTLMLTDEEWAEMQRCRAEDRKRQMEKAEEKRRQLADILEGRS